MRRLSELTFGVGHFSWTGDWPITVIGALITVVTLVGYYEERRQLFAESKEVEKAKTDDDESAPLIEEGAKAGRNNKRGTSWSLAVASGAAVIVFSVTLIYVNAWVLTDSRFPYICTYVAVQQAFCFVAASLLNYFINTTEVIEPMSWHSYATYFGPMGFFFAVYLWGSNTAYKFLQPGLIQMIKPIGTVFVFVNSCALGLEGYTRAKALNFTLICSGTLINVLPAFWHEDDQGAGTYDSTGAQIAYAIVALLAAYCCDAFYIVGLQLLQNGGFVTLRSQRLNPITTMINIAPIASVLLFFVGALTEREAFSRLGALPPWVWVTACLGSLGFNLAVTNFVGRFSATTYVVFDFLKDALIILVSFFFFAENFQRNELVAYTVIITGSCVWQHRKLYPITTTEAETTTAASSGYYPEAPQDNNNNNNNNTQTTDHLRR